MVIMLVCELDPLISASQVTSHLVPLLFYDQKRTWRHRKVKKLDQDHIT
jgi:hypothetical protein